VRFNCDPNCSRRPGFKSSLNGSSPEDPSWTLEDNYHNRQSHFDPLPPRTQPIFHTGKPAVPFWICDFGLRIGTRHEFARINTSDSPIAHALGLSSGEKSITSLSLIPTFSPSRGRRGRRRSLPALLIQIVKEHSDEHRFTGFWALLEIY